MRISCNCTVQEHAVRCGKKSTWRRWCETSAGAARRAWMVSHTRDVSGGGSNVGGACNLSQSTEDYGGIGDAAALWEESRNVVD